MKTITQYEADDGSVWTSEEECRDHELRLKGELAPRSDIGYMVIERHGKYNCYKRVGNNISNLTLISGGRELEQGDACEILFKNIGYYVPVVYIDDFVEDWEFPSIEKFEKYGNMIKQ